MERKTPRKRAIVAMAMFLVLGIQLGAAAPSGAAAPLAGHSVTTFSDGSEEATFYFPSQGGQGAASIALPRMAYVTSAGLSLRGMQGLDGSYPSDVRLAIGTAADSAWRFGERQAGAGQMGRQQLFSDGSDAADMRFPAGGGTASPAGILIPADAVIRSASLQLLGGEGPHGQPIVYGEGPQATLTAWNPAGGRALLAEVLNSTVHVYEVDPSTGAQLRHRELGLAPAEAGNVAGFQYSPQNDTAAVLVPGSGIFILDLGTGQTTRLYDDARAASLAAMSFGGGWVAAAGTGWAGVTMLPSGPSFDFKSTSGTDMLAGRPVAVDYDPAGSRLFSAHDTGSGKISIWAMATAGGGISPVDTGGQVKGLSAMRYLPDEGQLLLGERIPLSGGTVGCLVMLDISRGAVYHTLFSGGEGVDAIQLEGGHAASLVSEGELLVVDLRNDSHDVLPVEFPDGGRPLEWSFDFAQGRLVAATSGGSRYVLDFKSGSGLPLAMPGAAPTGINAARAAGNAMVFGTDTGLVALNVGGTPRWRLDCGQVSALSMDAGSTTLAAGARWGWSLDAATSTWGFGGLNLTVMDVRAGPSSARSWLLPLEKGAGRSRVSAIVLDSAGDRLFFGASGDGEESGLRRLNLSSGAVDTVLSGPYPFESLALSGDNRTLYAGTMGGGLLVVDIPTGASRALNSYNGSGLLSPYVSCLMVDEFGRVLAGQADWGRYSGGLTIFRSDMAWAQSYPSDPSLPGNAIDVHGISRDPRTMRIFLGLGGGGGLSIIDENANTQIGVPGLFGGHDATAITLEDVCWNPQDGTMLCAGSGLGFYMQWAGESPQNVGLDIGADGTVDWTAPGRLGRASITDMAAGVQGALAAAGGGPGLRTVYLRLSSTSAGIIGLRSLSITYEWSRRIDIGGMVRSVLASRAASGSGVVTVLLEANGGGLCMFNLSVTYMDDSPPQVKKMPQLTSDTIARAPAIIDLGRYFADSLSGANELTYTVRTSKAPAGVEISLLFSHYLLMDSRGSSFRGTITVNVTATDSSGLSSSAEFQVRVARSDEYAPPQPAYFTFLWIMAVVLAAVFCWILILYYRVRRAKKE